MRGYIWNSFQGRLKGIDIVAIPAASPCMIQGAAQQNVKFRKLQKFAVKRKSTFSHHNPKVTISNSLILRKVQPKRPVGVGWETPFLKFFFLPPPKKRLILHFFAILVKQWNPLLKIFVTIMGPIVRIFGEKLTHLGDTSLLGLCLNM